MKDLAAQTLVNEAGKTHVVVREDSGANQKNRADGRQQYFLVTADKARNYPKSNCRAPRTRMTV